MVAGLIVGARHDGHLDDILQVGTLRVTDADRAEIAGVMACRIGPEGEIYALERDRNGRYGSIMKYHLAECRAMTAG